MKTNYIVVLVTLLISISCITQFTPEIDEYGQILVVEGLVTNENRANTIKLSRTIPVGIAGISSPVVNATVTISDDLGAVTYLTEKGTGLYATDPATFQGVTGRSYKLKVITGGEVYESEYVLMRPVPEIDSIYSEFTYFDDGYNYPPLFAYDLFFDTEDPENNCRFFRWTYEEVWEYHLPFHYPPESKRICWVTKKSDDILIKNTSSLERGTIIKHPLVEIDNISSERISHKYSINLKQYSMTEDEFKYWENMQKLKEDIGGLYDPVPMPLQGNVKSISDPARSSLGYFSVSSVASKRMFIQNDTVKMLLGGSYCVTDTLDSLNGIAGLGVHIFVLEEIDGVGFLVSQYERCADCTLSGTNIEPSFWHDDLAYIQK
jgi:hypothetical protein